MTELSPAPDPRTLARHPQVVKSVASNHAGRTLNELTCLECGRTRPQAHGRLTTCPCGINLAPWGNTLYRWPATLQLPTPVHPQLPKGKPSATNPRPTPSTATRAAATSC